MIPKGLNLQLSLSAFVFLIFSCGEKSENYYSCSFIVDGERKSASSKSACDALEKDDEESSSADASNSNYRCAYSGNGTTYHGDTKEKCKELEEKYGLHIHSRKNVSR